MTDKEIILAFVRDLSFADHMGDVADDVVWLLRLLKVEVPPWGSMEDLSNHLDKLGVKHLYELV